MTRKQFVQALAIPAVAVLQLRAAATHVQVYKTPTCGCCSQWVEHLKKNGFDVTVQVVDDNAVYRKKLGLPDSMASCHTGVVEGYALEGHVPAAEIRRLLKEKPKARGLSVPGMVVGSPGMEVGTTKQPYSVMLVDAEGKASVYQKY